MHDPNREVMIKRCPLCQTAQGPTILSQYSTCEWHVAKCSACRFVFLMNPPDYSQLSSGNLSWETSFERQSVSRRRQKGIFARLVSTGLRKIKMRRGRVATSVVLATRYFRPGRLLDLGCGDGAVLCHVVKELTQTHCTSHIPIGVELSHVLAETARTAFVPLGGEVFEADALSALRAMRSGSYAGALLDSFLEHEHRPLEVLAELHRVLEPGACAVVKVPNYNSLNRVISGDKWCGFRLPDHVNYFTRSSMRQMADVVGFSIAKMTLPMYAPTSDSMYAVLRC